MLKRRFIVLLAGFVPLLSHAIDDKVVLGTAQDVSITAGDVRRELSLVPDAVIRRVLTDPQQHLALIDGMIRLELYAREAEALGVAADPKVQARIEKSRKQILAEVVREHVARSTEPPDFTELAREEYLLKKAEFVVPEQVRARHILLRFEGDAQKAEAIEKLRQIGERVRQGDSFEALAIEHSKDPGSAPQGGDLGLFGRGKMVEPFERAAFALRNPGELSDIVETRFGLHLIQLVERIERRERGFDEVKGPIIARIDADYRKKILESWDREMSEKASSDVDLEMLRKFFAQELERLK